MKTLTVFVCGLFPQSEWPAEGWIRGARADREPTFLSWADEAGVELREEWWDGRVESMIAAFRSGRLFVVRASNYMPASISAEMPKDRPQPDPRDVIVRTAHALGIPCFYYGRLMLPRPDGEAPLGWDDDGRGREALVDALEVMVEENE